MPDPYPTFDLCPNCGEMLWTDGTRLWCRDCEWTYEQRDLFTDQAETNERDTD